METRKNIKYRIASINENKLVKSIDNVEFIQITEESLKFQFKIDTLIKMSDNIIEVTPAIRYIIDNNCILEASATITFEVQTLDHVFVIDREKQEIKSTCDILSSFVEASFSTLRGIVYTTSKGTLLERFPMPMIDIHTLMAKNAVNVK